MTSEMHEVTSEPLQLEHVIRKVESPAAGAITTFIGTVREWTKGRRTIYLEYQAYVPMAVAMLEQIGHEVNTRWPGTKVAISHRIGSLNIGEAAVIIAVSSPHRRVAYEANAYAIERIKDMVPIWKKEHWENGEKWIGNQAGTVVYPDGQPEKEMKQT
ncbi:molybdenum cofactor biosynthesis protein MoaE [Aureibacillus halotolerans]|uniref:Molybdopterin synthase catalytic subunit n=1 Tax=Aureibacillus halotolerans TaxID=1508390 RepID=A0A4R6U7M2_9BACI|nr:molybdenum cofactor biosynthesis protein MoaE [Aureibacillus halotolerans]TDQ40739.1 molybdopterin synthase subunit MoaE [Aureibacillus halotolerans]